jgi:deoxyhypusine synthase
MNVAAKALQGNKLAFDPSLDVNETASIVLAAKRGLIRDDQAGPSSDAHLVSASGRGARIKGDKKKGSRSKKGGRSAIFILGGGSPKNFALQTEPQIQEVLGIDERGHDYFLQVTDARPDTGGLSGATPAEAVSWGKIDPDQLPDAVVCYLDSTVALPIITAYALAKHKPRPPRRLYDRREEFMQLLLTEYQKSSRR